jgi:hypothetical protein
MLCINFTFENIKENNGRIKEKKLRNIQIIEIL